MKQGNKRLDLEWLVISALRENLSLIQGNETVPYDETIQFAQENFKELFDRENSFFGKRSTRGALYEKYVQKALAKSRKENKKITPESLIQDDIDEITDLLKFRDIKEERFTRLKSERRKLNKLLKENVNRITRVTENQALMNDFSYKRPGLDFQDSFAGKYNIYKTNTDQKFILRFLHLGAAEAATGVDLIYELYDKKNQMVRIIAVQYKMWEKGVLYFSQSDNIEQQLLTAKECFCGKGFCESSNSTKREFRLPYCTPFLRPTERIYDTDNLLTSGWHIPVCEVNNYAEKTYDNNKILKLEKIRSIALDIVEFEKLFQQEKIGSRWLSLKEVEVFYKQKKVISKDENIVIFSQKTI